MKIGIDVRMYQESGIGRYIRNLLSQFYVLDTVNEYVLFCLKNDADDLAQKYPRWKIVVADFKWYTVSEQIKFPSILYSAQCDIVHFPHFNVPLLYLKKYIVTIHDLTHFTFAMNRASTHSAFTYAVKHHAYSLAFTTAVRRSAHILTVSNYVRDQLIEKFSLNTSKITVTYEAVEEEFISQKIVSNNIPAGISSPFFLYVGNAHPHKNVEFMLKSFSELRSKYPHSSLLLVGKENYFWREVMRWADENNCAQNVHYLGFQPDSVVAALMLQATAYLFPSLSEGFGLPALEAMAVGCPVICANTTALPEVAGDAALYINPHDTNSLIDAMENLLNDSNLCNSLMQKGKERVSQFSWKTAAQTTLNIYQNN